MERIATSFCSFETLRKRYTYVDKTDMLWRLVSDAEDRMFFLSRPRRFGKSLMLDTLKCIFEGRRELFRGLKIEKKRYDWKKYPVVMLNMADITASTVEELREGLLDTIDALVGQFGCKGVVKLSNPGKYLGNFFKVLAAEQGEFVVLVDEYDVPLQGFLGDRRAIVAVRKLMHDFYIQLKNNSGSIRFMMMTGESVDDEVVPNNLNRLEDDERYDKLLEDRVTEKERKSFEAGAFVAMAYALDLPNLEPLMRLRIALFDTTDELSPHVVVNAFSRYLIHLSLVSLEWRIRSEADAKRHFRLFMEMLGAKVTVEEGSARGCADAIIETKTSVWIFEFKFNKSPAVAIRQIREKGYADPYRGDRRPVTLVGINFRTAKRNIDVPLIEPLRKGDGRKVAGKCSPC